MPDRPGRIARLVLVTPGGELVGSLPPLEVETPWWPDVEPIVRATRETYGIDVTVLRMLQVESATSRGGNVTYLAEVAHRVAAEPWAGSLDEHPLRQTFARPGGPAADLAWAHGVLTRLGLHSSAPALQVKTWNLSSLWRIPLVGQSAWLKVVPPFMAHEGPLLAYLAGQPVPTLLGQSGCRSLFAEIPGRDLYAPALSVRRDMVSLLVALQYRYAGRTAELRALQVPDWRSPVLIAAIAEVCDRTSAELSVEDNAALRDFVRALPERCAEVDACGVPNSLVHGDFWPGNLRGEPDRLTLLDWGDSGVGNPLLDQSAFLERVPPDDLDAIRQHWIQQWRIAVPDSDPARAFARIGPISEARRAVVYRRFLDQIEPSEYPYHRSDPADMLRRTAALLRAGG
jgi:hypothetical protein